MAAGKVPDDIDLSVIACFRRNPRITNKAIAAQLGLAEPTVAARIRALTEGDVMRVMAQRDLKRAGYGVMSFLSLHVPADGLEAAIAGLAAIDEAFSVVQCAGGPEIVANVNTRDLDHLNELMVGPVASLPGVGRIELSICLKVHKFRAGLGELSRGFATSNAATASDELDEQVIALLVEDGRISNREIGRRLSISEGSVRQRLKRLEEGKIIRLGVVCAPDKLAPTYAAYMSFAVEPSAAAAAAACLADMDAASFVASTTGRFNLTTLVTGPDLLALSRDCERDLRRHCRVIDAAFKPITETAKHRYDFVHLDEV